MHLQDITVDFPVIAKGTKRVLHGSFHQGFYNKLKKNEESQMNKEGYID